MPQPLHVALNLFYLVERSGGAGTYAQELLRGMFAAEPDTRVTAFTSKEIPPEYVARDWGGHVDWVPMPFTVTHGPPGNFVATMGAQWGAIPLLAARRGCDVVHGLANITPLVAPRVPTVVTVLDLIWVRYPHTMERRATVGMKLVTPPSAHFADRTIAISHASKADLVETIGLDPARVDVTWLGVDPPGAREATDAAELRERLGLPAAAPVVLCVAQKREHKNLLGLVRALARVSSPDAVLVLPGAHTPHEDELRAEATALGITERVVFPEWLSDADLEGLYRLAACFVLPSFEEGFGLPVLEAMARDVPVATSNCSSMPEVAGDAALLFDPQDPASIAGCIDRLLADPELAQSLVARGRERVAAFPWQATAEATLDVYRRAIADRRGRRGGGVRRLTRATRGVYGTWR
ncbi:glycosyltransferase [Paraconexibacter sp. AEG42_29]|uniref:Glycosyltransferase n=1 Tax=Paraconexibacter sp. AEG42_29 TaxID=2997339 RepID=A0AAU7B2C2_9ACTN